MGAETKVKKIMRFNCDDEDVASSESIVGPSRAPDSLSVYQNNPPDSSIEPTVAPVKRNKRTDKKVIYPFLAEAMEYEEDPFWVTELDKASRGVFPKGFSYENGYLVHRVKNKINKTRLPTDPQELKNKVIAEFRKNRGMKSELDRIANFNNFEKHRNEYDVGDTPWNKLNPHHREQLVSRYVEKKKKSMKLSKYSVQSLSDLIRTGIFMKWLTEEDVVIENCNIMEIKNVGYDEETKLFYLTSKRNIDKKEASRKVVETEKKETHKIWKGALNHFYGESKIKFNINYNEDKQPILTRHVAKNSRGSGKGTKGNPKGTKAPVKGTKGTSKNKKAQKPQKRKRINKRDETEESEDEETEEESFDVTETESSSGSKESKGSVGA